MSVVVNYASAASGAHRDVPGYVLIRELTGIGHAVEHPSAILIQFAGYGIVGVKDSRGLVSKQSETVFNVVEDVLRMTVPSEAVLAYVCNKDVVRLELDDLSIH